MLPLVSGGGGLLCESVGKADLLSDHFDGNSPGSPSLTCHPSPRLATFSFRSSEVRLLLFDLRPYGGTNQLGLFPLFPKKTVMFWSLIFLQCFG